MDNAEFLFRVESIQDSIRKIQELVENALIVSENYTNRVGKLCHSEEHMPDLPGYDEQSVNTLNIIVEDELGDGEAYIDDNTCDDLQQHIFIEDKSDDDAMVENKDVDRDGNMDDPDGNMDKLLVDTIPNRDLMTYHSVVYCDPFWIPIFASSVETQMRFLLLKMTHTSNPDLIFDLADNPSLKHLSEGDYFIIRSVVMRGCYGFNGPGNSQVAITFSWSLVRDYDGFNGPGHLEDKVFFKG